MVNGGSLLFTWMAEHYAGVSFAGLTLELKDGKGSLIHFDYNAGLYTVPKQLDNGYLAIGKKRVDFHRTGEKNYINRFCAEY